MTEELIDRFGDIPKTVQLLLHAAALKNLAHAAYVTAVEQKGDAIRFVMYERAKIDPAKIPALLASLRKRSVVPNGGSALFSVPEGGKERQSRTGKCTGYGAQGAGRYPKPGASVSRA